MTETTPDTAALLHRERERQAALIAADFRALDRILADDLIHVHGGGNVDTKAQYFALMQSLFDFVAIERQGLNIQVYNDIAIMTGGMTHVVRLKADGARRSIDAFGTQIWRRSGQTWQLILYQATEIRPH